MNERIIVDRTENGFAVCELSDGTFINIPLTEFSEDIKEGDVLYMSPDGKYTVDKSETVRRKERLFNLQNSLFDN